MNKQNKFTHYCADGYEVNSRHRSEADALKRLDPSGNWRLFRPMIPARFLRRVTARNHTEGST